MTLADLSISESGIITAVGGTGALRRRLLDMGLTPHTRVRIRKMAPLGDPIELDLRGYVLTVRQEDAEKIEVKKIQDAAAYIQAERPLLNCGERDEKERPGVLK